MAYALFGSEIKPIIISYPNGANAIRPYKNAIAVKFNNADHCRIRGRMPLLQ